MRRDSHITDEDLLRAMDGELEDGRAGEVNSHLRECVECRGRRAAFERASNEFAEFRASRVDWRAKLPARGWQWGWAAAAAILAVGLVWRFEGTATAAPLPDAKLTPGATRTASSEQVCAMPAEAGGAAVSPEMAKVVFRQYGIERPRPRAYEVDYLITPALGGAEDVRNLWPQPYGGSVWTAHVKDALEDYFRQRVCSGELELAMAQREMAADWIAAYRKYFQSERPLARHMSFLKDRPWE